MAKQKERRIAQIQYVEQNKTAKEISRGLNVTENTVGSWIRKYGWKQLKEAKVMSYKKDVDNIKAAISHIAQSRLDVEENIQLAISNNDKEEETRLRKIAYSLAGEVGLFNKSLERLDKENKISLSKYLDVMDSIFKSMQAEYPKLFIQTLDFQESHINEIAIKLG